MQKTELKNKISKALNSSRFDATIITGYENIHYLSGIELPFALYRQDQPIFFVAVKNTEPVFICPMEWVKTAIFTGWFNKVIGYRADSKDFSDAIKKVVETAGKSKKIAIDLDRTTVGVFTALQKGLPKATFTACDAWLNDLRMVKTEVEKKMLDRVAYLTDHGMNGALHHVTVDRRTTELTLAEEFRVHTIERGVDVVGYHCCTNVNSGSETPYYWANPAKFGYSMTNDLHPAEMARLKVIAEKEGYWTDSTRTMVLGDMLEDQEKYYGMLVALREAAINTIKAGVSAADVYEAMCACAKKRHINLVDTLDLGHGIGSSLTEPPFINPCDQTSLKKDMVLVISPVVKADNGELWMGKDTVIVTETGCDIIGWYKDWREPYIPIASI